MISIRATDSTNNQTRYHSPLTVELSPSLDPEAKGQNQVETIVNFLRERGNNGVTQHAIQKGLRDGVIENNGVGNRMKVDSAE